MSKKDKKITTLGYTIEALEDEISGLEERLRDQHEKMWAVICENDRLTLTYEPYRPPGDRYEGLEFYGLVEENDELTQKVLDKMEIIREQDSEILNLKNRNAELLSSLIELKKVQAEKKIAKEYKPLIKNERWWNFSVELWPGAWGLNYYRYNWQKYGSDSREGQMQIGPFGLSWNREPKRKGNS